MQVVEDITQKTKKSLNVSVGNVTAGSKEEIKKQIKKKYDAERYILNRDKLLKQSKKWRDANKKHHAKWKLKYNRKRLKEDLNFKLIHNCRVRIRRALISKSKRTMKLLGCTVTELWKHLEKQFQPGMTRENYGEWHVDHIKPCALFDLTRDEEQAICFHYTNLQPLWAVDNIRKGKKYYANIQDRTTQEVEEGSTSREDH